MFDLLVDRYILAKVKKLLLPLPEYLDRDENGQVPKIAKYIKRSTYAALRYRSIARRRVSFCGSTPEVKEREEKERKRERKREREREKERERDVKRMQFTRHVHRISRSRQCDCGRKSCRPARDQTSLLGVAQWWHERTPRRFGVGIRQNPRGSER